MKINYIKKLAERYIIDNNIDKNTYQIKKAFVDGAKMILSEQQTPYRKCTCINPERWIKTEKGVDIDFCKRCHLPL